MYGCHCGSVSDYLDDIMSLNLDRIDEFIFLGDLNMPTAYGPGREANGDKCTGSYRTIHEYKMM